MSSGFLDKEAVAEAVIDDSKIISSCNNDSDKREPVVSQVLESSVKSFPVQRTVSMPNIRPRPAIIVSTVQNKCIPSSSTVSTSTSSMNSIIPNILPRPSIVGDVKIVADIPSSLAVAPQSKHASPIIVTTVRRKRKNRFASIANLKHGLMTTESTKNKIKDYLDQKAASSLSNIRDDNDNDNDNDGGYDGESNESNLDNGGNGGNVHSDNNSDANSGRNNYKGSVKGRPRKGYRSSSGVNAKVSKPGALFEAIKPQLPPGINRRNSSNLPHWPSSAGTRRQIIVSSSNLNPSNQPIQPSILPINNNHNVNDDYEALMALSTAATNLDSSLAPSYSSTLRATTKPAIQTSMTTHNISQNNKISVPISQTLYDMLCDVELQKKFNCNSPAQLVEISCQKLFSDSNQ